MREDKWGKFESKLSSSGSGGVKYTMVKFRNTHISGAALRPTNQPEKKEIVAATPGVNEKI